MTEPYHTAMLVINGVGNHPPTQTLEAITEPLLARMRAEGVLVEAVATQLGDPDKEFGGQFDAIAVDYWTSPPSDPLPPPGTTYELKPNAQIDLLAPPELRRALIVEGRWQGLYRKADAPKMSGWIYARQTGMAWEVVKYLWRSWASFLPSALFVLLVVSAVALAGWNPSLRWAKWILLVESGGTLLGLFTLLMTRGQRREQLQASSHGDRQDTGGIAAMFFAAATVPAIWATVRAFDGFEPSPYWLLGSALGIALGSSLKADVGEHWEEKHGDSKKYALAVLELAISACLFLVYTTTRVVIVAAALLAIGVFLVVTPLIRLLASIPFTSKLRWWLFSKFEVGLFTGGFADMEAVLNNHVAVTATRVRLWRALEVTREDVTPGNAITVVVHSGGAPLAWELLSSKRLEDDLSGNPATRHRFKLITVGAGLNWARKGLNDREATRLDAPLVTGGLAGDEPTEWLNIYSSWDPTPHGPIDFERWPKNWRPLFGDKTTPASAAALNLMVRNLGAPVREEHREYWYNQEQVVPVVAGALDPDMVWAMTNARDDVGAEWRTHWANVRLALVSTLVRVRLLLIACLLAVVVQSLQLGDSYHSLLAVPLRFPDVPHVNLGIPGLALDEALCADASYRQGGGVEECDGVPRDRDKGLQGALEYISVHDTLGRYVAIGATALFAYLLMNVYTNLFWAQLARRALPYGMGKPDRHMRRFEYKRILTPWVVVVVPLALSLGVFAFELPMDLRIAVVASAFFVSLCECGWLAFSVAAARTKGEAGKWDAYRRKLGRKGPEPPMALPVPLIRRIRSKKAGSA